MTLLNRIKTSFDENADFIAISFQGKEYSYETLSKLVAYRISEIEKCFVGVGDIVSIENKDPLEYWVSCLSCLFLGLTITPFRSNDGLPDDFAKKRYVGNDSNADIKVTLCGEIDVENLLITIKIPTLINTDLSVIFFTSGTTGRKKSIGLTNNIICSRIQASQKFFPRNSVSFTFMPPFSSLAFNFHLRQWIAGGLVILDSEFENVIKALSKYSVDYVVGSPHQYTSFLNDLSDYKILEEFRVDSLVVTGGNLTKPLKEKLSEVFLNVEIFC
jgi:acyl-CoA synthetase (AMP-forming)/AMP-acid ligase II